MSAFAHKHVNAHSSPLGAWLTVAFGCSIRSIVVFSIGPGRAGTGGARGFEELMVE